MCCSVALTARHLRAPFSPLFFVLFCFVAAAELWCWNFSLSLTLALFNLEKWFLKNSLNLFCLNDCGFSLSLFLEKNIKHSAFLFCEFFGFLIKFLFVVKFNAKFFWLWKEFFSRSTTVALLDLMNLRESCC